MLRAADEVRVLVVERRSAAVGAELALQPADLRRGTRLSSQPSRAGDDVASARMSGDARVVPAPRSSGAAASRLRRDQASSWANVGQSAGRKCDSDSERSTVWPEVVRELLVRVDGVVVRAEDRDLLGPEAEVDGGRVDDQRAEAVADDGDRRVARDRGRHGARLSSLRALKVKRPERTPALGMSRRPRRPARWRRTRPSRARRRAPARRPRPARRRPARSTTPTAAKSPITQSAPSVSPARDTTNARGPTSARGPTRSSAADRLDAAALAEVAAVAELDPRPRAISHLRVAAQPHARRPRAGARGCASRSHTSRTGPSGAGSGIDDAPGPSAAVLASSPSRHSAEKERWTSRPPPSAASARRRSRAARRPSASTTRRRSARPSRPRPPRAKKHRRKKRPVCKKKKRHPKPPSGHPSRGRRCPRRRPRPGPQDLSPRRPRHRSSRSSSRRSPSTTVRSASRRPSGFCGARDSARGPARPPRWPSWGWRRRSSRSRARAAPRRWTARRRWTTATRSRPTTTTATTSCTGSTAWSARATSSSSASRSSSTTGSRPPTTRSARRG